MTLVARRDDPMRPDVVALLGEHLEDMRALSPADSVHALDPAALTAAGVALWTVRAEGALLGCGALAPIAEGGELKSMRTAAAARGRGVAALVLAAVIGEARDRGYPALLLETGTHPFFAPARRLYERHGFRPCAPFGRYRPDPHSAFYRLPLTTGMVDGAAGF